MSRDGVRSTVQHHTGHRTENNRFDTDMIAAAMRGEKVKLYPLELADAIDGLLLDGLTQAEIARTLGCAYETVRLRVRETRGRR